MKKLLLFFIFSSFFIVRVQAQSYTIVTIAGNGIEDYSGDGGQASAAEINFPQNISISNSSGSVYIADAYNERIREVNNSGIISTIAGNGIRGFSGDGGPATAAEFYNPYGVLVDNSGKIYIADWLNYRIRMMNTSGIISTYAGNGTGGYSGDGGPATAAELLDASGLFLDGSGNLYITYDENNRIRKVNTAGIITTVVGNGISGYSGDGGPATAAELDWPSEVTLDDAGNIYLADEYNNRIRKVNTTDIITTIAGTGVEGYSGDGGAATAAELHWPSGIAVSSSGKMYIADYQNNRIREVSSLGIINTIAGTGTAGYSGDGGPALSAELDGPIGTQLDQSGNVYFPDLNNNRIRKLIPSSLSVSINQTSNVSCNGESNGSASVVINGGSSPYTYSWSPEGGSGSSASGLSAGTYTVAVTDNNGLSNSITVTITQPPVLTVSADASADNCNGTANDSISAKVSGGSGPYTYSWTPTVQTTAIATGLSAGTYTITVTDNNGCTASASTSIILSPPVIVTSEIINTLNCYNQNTGIILATPSGGISPYTYSWSPDGGNSPTATELSAGTYIITLTDSAGCTATASAILTQPPPMTLSYDSVAAVVNDSCNGEAFVTVVNGGIAPYTYLWTPEGQTTDSITNECAGEYCCVITDNNGCSQIACITVESHNQCDPSGINLYPNPNIGLFTLTDMVPGQQVDLYNSIGQHIGSSIATNSTMQFNISTKARGVYIIKVSNDGCKTVEKKIVKIQ